MAGKISIECPACSAKLNISDPSKLGKKLKCPKCQEMFTPEAPADDDDLMDDYDDEGEKQPKLAPIQRRSSGAASGKGGGRSSGKQSSETSSNGLLIGGIGAAVVLLLVGIGLIASGAFSSSAPPINPGAAPVESVASTPVNPTPPSNPTPAASPSTPIASTIPVAPSSAPGSTSKPSSTSSAPADAEKTLGLRWLADDTDVLIHIKPAAIMKAPLIKKFIEAAGGMAALEEQTKKLGIGLTDVESITVGFPDFVGTLLKGISKQVQSKPKRGAPPVAENPFKDLRFVLVVKGSSSANLTDVTKSLPDYKEQSADGKAYFTFAHLGTLTDDVGGWLPDPKTLIIATDKELKSSLQKGEASTLSKEYSSIDPKFQLIFAGRRHELTSDEKPMVQAMLLNPMTAQFASQLAEKSPLQFYSFGLTVKGGIDVSFAATFDSAESAGKFKAEFEKERDGNKAAFQATKKIMPPLIGELGEQVLESLKIQEQDRTVKVSLGLPDAAQSKLEQLPAQLMALAPMLTGAGPNFGIPFNSMGGAAPTTDDSTKQPGETASVDPASVEGLPAGLTIEAKSAWSAEPTTLLDGSSAITMEIIVDVTGDPVDKICAATSINSKTIKLDSSTKLRLAKVLHITGIDTAKTPLPFDVDDPTDTTHPAKTLRVRLIAEAPSASSTATKVEQLEGSFKILIAEEAKEFTIEDATKTARRPLAEAEFKTADLKLRRSLSEVTPPTFTLSVGKDHFIGLVKGSPDDYFSVTEIDKDQPVQRMYANEKTSKFPEDFQLTFKLYSKVEEHTVSFKFENIPLPDKASKPKLAGQAE